MKRTIEVHIDELVLHGFEPHQRHAIGDAFHEELMRLLGERGIDTTRGIDIAGLDAGSFVLPPGGRAAGRGIARSVHAALPRSRG